MARVLSTAFLVGMLAATAAAFALTEGAKLELAPIYGTQVAKVFSPGITNGTIDFRLRKAERVSVWMTRNGKRVATVVPPRNHPRGWVHVVFTGVSASGLTLPDGNYVPVVHLARSHRTITLPNTIVLDTKPPVVTVRHRIYTHISPGVAGHGVFVVAYSVNEPARGILYADEKQVELTYKEPLHGVLRWNGKVNGRLVGAGNHVLEIAAQDVAGNRSKPIPFAVVAVRYVELGRTRILARPGAKFSVLVLTDAPSVTYLFHGRRVHARHGTLTLRAPKTPGVYRLYVEAAGHAAKALVVVA